MMRIMRGKKVKLRTVDPPDYAAWLHKNEKGKEQNCSNEDEERCDEGLFLVKGPRRNWRIVDWWVIVMKR